jgi:hypothetical protein
MARGSPERVAPSSAKNTSRAQARRGLSDESRAQIVKTGKIAVTGATAAGVLYVGGRAIETVLDARAREREASRARVDVVQVPLDVNGDGLPDTSNAIPLVLGADGAYDAFGAAPSYTKKEASTATDIQDTAKTLGYVVAGVVVVATIAYALTRPGVARSIRGAFT